MELLDIINENDFVIGRASREEVYNQKLKHRIVHVFVINPNDKTIYLQKRSNRVSYLPEHYCTSAGGHVLSGESYESAASRELKEELGIESNLVKIADSEFVLEGHSRKVRLFAVFYEGNFNFSDGEVESGKFYGPSEARALIERGEKIHPQLEFCFKLLEAYFLNGLTK